MNRPARILGFDEQVLNVRKAITDFDSGKKQNIAIIAEPFAGKTSLLDMIEKEHAYAISRHSVPAIIDHNGTVTAASLEKIVMIDDCHLLHIRKIGGFSILEAFLKDISASDDHLFITAWNQFAWNYLKRTININKYFPLQIDLPRLKDSEIKESILSAYEPGEITFINDIEVTSKKIFEVTRHPVAIRPLHRTVDIPFFSIDFAALRTKFRTKEDEIATEDLLFKKINRIANGNPGIAQAIWEKNLAYPTAKLSQFEQISHPVDLDYHEAFMLSLILAARRVTKDNLTDMEDDSDAALFRLLEQGLIEIDEGMYSVKPEAMRNSADLLKKLRLVW